MHVHAAAIPEGIGYFPEDPYMACLTVTGSPHHCPEHGKHAKPQYTHCAVTGHNISNTHQLQHEAQAQGDADLPLMSLDPSPAIASCTQDACSRQPIQSQTSDCSTQPWSTNKSANKTRVIRRPSPRVIPTPTQRYENCQLAAAS